MMETNIADNMPLYNVQKKFVMGRKILYRQMFVQFGLGLNHASGTISCLAYVSLCMSLSIACATGNSFCCMDFKFGTHMPCNMSMCVN